MIIEHAKTGSNAVIMVFIVLFAVLALVFFFPEIFFNEKYKILIQLMNGFGGIMYAIAFWQFAKAKGYSGYFGLLLSILGIIGIVVLIFKKDKCKEQPFTFVR